MIVDLNKAPIYIIEASTGQRIGKVTSIIATTYPNSVELKTIKMIGATQLGKS